MKKLLAIIVSVMMLLNISLSVYAQDSDSSSDSSANTSGETVSKSDSPAKSETESKGETTSKGKTKEETASDTGKNESDKSEDATTSDASKDEAKTEEKSDTKDNSESTDKTDSAKSDTKNDNSETVKKDDNSENTGDTNKSDKTDSSDVKSNGANESAKTDKEDENTEKGDKTDSSKKDTASDRTEKADKTDVKDSTDSDFLNEIKKALTSASTDIKACVKEFKKNFADKAKEDRQKLLKALGELKKMLDDISIDTVINGIFVDFDKYDGVKPFTENGRTLAPVRAVSESFDANVSWNGDDETITITKGDTVIKMAVGSTKAYVNGEEVTLDTAPEIFNERTVVPVRFIAESFGLNVSWDEGSGTVIIE